MLATTLGPWLLLDSSQNLSGAFALAPLVGIAIRLAFNASAMPTSPPAPRGIATGREDRGADDLGRMGLIHADREPRDRRLDLDRMALQQGWRDDSGHRPPSTPRRRTGRIDT